MRERADEMAGAGAMRRRAEAGEGESLGAASPRRRESRPAAKSARIRRAPVHQDQRLRLVRQIHEFRAGGRGIRSGRAAPPGHEIGRIRKKIIGRRLGVQALAVRGKSGFRGENAPGRRTMARAAAADVRLNIWLGREAGLPGGFGIALALVHQPAGEHGGGVFFEPLVEQGRNLLAEIGGVSEPCEFVALEAVARSREQELPRGLSRVASQGYLPKEIEDDKNTVSVILSKSTSMA
jgi:hypothetical protein